MSERWLPIADFPDYAVSNRGRVMRCTTRTFAKAGTILKQCWRGGRANDHGYLAVDLCRDGKRRMRSVHTLVAEAFLGPRPAGHQPNHKDAIRENNAASNLEWATQSRNVKHAYELGLRDASGEGNGRAKLTDEVVLSLRREAPPAPRRRFYLAEASRLGLSETTIRHAVQGITWSHLPGAAA